MLQSLICGICHNPGKYDQDNNQNRHQNLENYVYFGNREDFFNKF